MEWFHTKIFHWNSYRWSLQIHGNEIEKEGGIVNIFNTGDIRFKHREIILWEDHTIDPDHSLFLIAFSDSFVSLATSPFALPVQRDPQALKLKNKNMTLSVPQKRIRLRKNNWADKQINDLQVHRFFATPGPAGGYCCTGQVAVDQEAVFTIRGDSRMKEHNAIKVWSITMTWHVLEQLTLPLSLGHSFAQCFHGIPTNHWPILFSCPPNPKNWGWFAWFRYLWC